DRELDQHSFGRGDGEGGMVRLSLWNHPGDTIYGMFARCQTIVNSAEKLLGGEVYHYHSKMIMKDPKVGGAWAWHQDYGYWYQNGVLQPLLTSAFIAVDPCTRENGCLQVVRGSHHCGRIDHVLTGDQAGAAIRLTRFAMVKGIVPRSGSRQTSGAAPDTVPEVWRLPLQRLFDPSATRRFHHVRQWSESSSDARRGRGGRRRPLGRQRGP